MTTRSTARDRLLGTLRAADGRGVVRVEDRFATDVDDLWSAITVPNRLDRWWGHVDGDLRVGGTFLLSAEWDGSGRVEACEAPRHLRVTIRESDESFQKGNGVPPFDSSVEATLTADGDDTVLVVEVRGMPLDKIAYYGTGWQIHLEKLAVYVAGDEQGDTESRWGDLVPPYQKLADHLAKAQKASELPETISGRRRA